MSLPDEVQREIAELEADIESLARQQQELQARARLLMEKEAAGLGTFAGEIFRLKQERLMLATEVQHKKVRLNHLLFSV